LVAAAAAASFFSRCSAAAAGCHRCRSRVFDRKLTLVTTGARRHCCRFCLFTVVLLLLVATNAARELSKVNYTCDYYCCSPPLLLPFFSTVVLLLLVGTDAAREFSSEN
jgi:hypothetical protein